MDPASEDESTSSEQDESKYHLNMSEEDGSEYQPSSSGEDGSDYKPHRPQETNNDVETHLGPVTLDQHHLRATTDLEVGTAINTGEILELQDGSFLKITHFGGVRNSRSVPVLCHPLSRIKEFHNYLPMTTSGTELIWVYEAKEHDDNPEGYLKSATTKDVLRTRHLVLPIPESAFKSLPQFEATRVFMDSRPLFCQWILVAELSNPRITGGKRSSKLTMEGSQGQAKALSSHRPVVGGCLPARIPW